MRQPLVAGNWKMHGSRESVVALLGALSTSVKGAAVRRCGLPRLCAPAAGA